MDDTYINLRIDLFHFSLYAYYIFYIGLKIKIFESEHQFFNEGLVAYTIHLPLYGCSNDAIIL